MFGVKPYDFGEVVKCVRRIGFRSAGKKIKLNERRGKRNINRRYSRRCLIWVVNGGKTFFPRTDPVRRWQHWSVGGRDKGRINAAIGCFLVCHRECFTIIKPPCTPIETTSAAKFLRTLTATL